MSTITPGDLIRLALRDAGVNGTGQTPSAEDSNDAYLHLQMMLAQWDRRRYLIYHLIDVPKVSTGAQSYTIGVGGDFNSARPDRIEAAFVRFLGGTTTPDIELQVIESREDFNRICVKSVQSMPEFVWYDAAFPLGVLHFYPVAPRNSYELHVSVKDTLTAFAGLATPINMPDEYLEALLYNLAIRLRIAYQMPPDQAVNALAKAALATIRGANTQIARLELPAAVLGRGRGDSAFFGSQAARDFSADFSSDFS